MEFRYAIIFVQDVIKTLEFYEKVFKLKTKFIHRSKNYRELDSGSTILFYQRRNVTFYHFYPIIFKKILILLLKWSLAIEYPNKKP